MAKTAAKLQPKHYKALELWQEGILSIKEISQACEISINDMYDLFEGNAQSVGYVAHLFKAELEKITTRTSSKIKQLVKDNKSQALWMMNTRLKELKSKKRITENDTKEIVSIMNSLNKATPGIEIGNYSLSFTKGMTPEELVYEFKRLTALARLSPLGGRVPEVDGGAEGGISEPPTDGGSVQEE